MIKYLKIILLLYILLCSHTIFAQYLIGQVKDSISGNGIYGVSVANLSSGIISSYAITDIDGKFTLKYQAGIIDAYISFSHITYKTKIVTVNDFANTLTVHLLPQKTILPEVKVASTPISKKGDTLTYNVDRFTTKEDRVIGDLIKRLPGVSVTANGTITFNGKAISNYYIEGLDLLEGKYNLANENINIEMVDKVQILENNQPIKVLDSSMVAINPALNIKLKSNAINKLFKNVETHVGYDTAILIGLNLNGMKFAKKNQLLAGYKRNNFGDSYDNDIVEHYTIDNLDEKRKNENRQPVLSFVNDLPPVIKKNYSNFNVTNFAYFNGLNVLTKSKQLKYSIDLYNNKQQTFYDKNTNYTIPNSNIIVNENQQTNINTLAIRGNVKYIINRPSLYLSNKLNTNITKENTENTIQALKPVNQTLQTKLALISNDLMLYKKIGKQLYQITSYVYLSNIPSTLAMSPGMFIDLYNNNIPYTLLRQDAAISYFRTINSLSFKNYKYGLLHKYSVTVDYEKSTNSSNAKKVFNSIETSLNGIFKNNVNTTKSIAEINYNVYYNKKKINTVINLPLQLAHVAIINNSNNLKNTYLFFNPSLQFNYKISQFFNASFSTQYLKLIEPSIKTATGIISTSYRTLQQGVNIVPINVTKPISATIYYKNIRKTLFAYINGSIAYSTNNININQQYIGINVINTFVPLANPFKSSLIIGNISKYIRAVKLNISAKGSITTNKINIFFNALNQTIKNNIATYSLDLSTRAIKQVNIENNINYMRSSTKLKTKITQKSFNQFANRFSISKFFSNNFTIKTSVNYYNFNNTSWYFIDLGLNYKAKRYELAINGNNLANNKCFSWAEISDNAVIQTEYRLRPLNGILKLSFRL